MSMSTEKDKKHHKTQLTVIKPRYNYISTWVAIQVTHATDVLIIQVTLQSVPPRKSPHTSTDHEFAFKLVRLVGSVSLIISGVFNVHTTADPLVVFNMSLHVSFEIR